MHYSSFLHRYASDINGNVRHLKHQNLHERANGARTEQRTERQTRKREKCGILVQTEPYGGASTKIRTGKPPGAFPRASAGTVLGSAVRRAAEPPHGGLLRTAKSRGANLGFLGGDNRTRSVLKEQVAERELARIGRSVQCDRHRFGTQCAVPRTAEDCEEQKNPPLSGFWWSKTIRNRTYQITQTQ